MKQNETRRNQKERKEMFESIPNYDGLLRSSEVEVLNDHLAGIKKQSLSFISNEPSKLRTMYTLLIVDSVADDYEVAEYEKLTNYKKAENELKKIQAQISNSPAYDGSLTIQLVNATNKAEKATKAYLEARANNDEVKNVLARYSKALETTKAIREDFTSNETKVFNFLYNFVTGNYTYIAEFEELVKACNEYRSADTGEKNEYTKHCYMNCKLSIQKVLVDGFKITDEDESVVFKSHVSNFNGTETHNIINLLSSPAMNEVLASDGFNTFTIGHMAVETFTEVVNKLIIGKFGGVKFIFEKTEAQKEFEAKQEAEKTKAGTKAGSKATK